MASGNPEPLLPAGEFSANAAGRKCKERVDKNSPYISIVVDQRLGHLIIGHSLD